MRTIECKDCNKTVDALSTRGGKCSLCYQQSLKKNRCEKCAAFTDGGLCKICSIKNKITNKKSGSFGQVCFIAFNVANEILIHPIVFAVAQNAELNSDETENCGGQGGEGYFAHQAAYNGRGMCECETSNSVWSAEL